MQIKRINRQKVQSLSIAWMLGLILSLNIFSINNTYAQQENLPYGQLVFPYQQLHVHGSSVVELPDSSLLVVWFEGSGERQADDVAILGARLPKGAKSWSKPFVMADVPGFPDINPVVFLDKKSQLWLVWYTVLANQWESSLLKYRISTNYLQPDRAPQWDWQDVIHVKAGGSTERGIQPSDPFVRSVKAQLDSTEAAAKKVIAALPKDEAEKMIDQWVAFKELILNRASGKDMMRRGRVITADGSYNTQPMGYPQFRRIGWQSRNKPFQYANGKILLPLYSDGLEMSLVAITDDYGKNWSFSTPKVGIANIQAAIGERADGSLVAYMRDNGPPPQLLQMSISNDQGKSWGPVHDSKIPNPGSAADLVELTNGHWVLVHNDTENGRHRLALILSEDEGRTWPYKKYIEDDTGKTPGIRSHYPAIIQGMDGSIHITYSHHIESKPQKKSIKYVKVTEDWIKGQ